MDNAGPLLLRAGLVTEAQLKGAYATLAQSGGTVVEALIAGRVLDEPRLCRFFGERLLVPLVGPAELQAVPSPTIALLPAELAGQFRAVPIEVRPDGALVLAMADPSDTHAVDEITYHVKRVVVRAAAPPTAIAAALARYYGLRVPLLEARVTTPTAPTGRADPGASPAPAAAAAPVGPAKKLPPAVVVDEIYDQETPLPVPIPFDENTSKIVALMDVGQRRSGQRRAGPVQVMAALGGATPVTPPAAPSAPPATRSVAPAPRAAASATTAPATAVPVAVTPAVARRIAIAAPPAPRAEGAPAMAAATAALARVQDELAHAVDRDAVSDALVAYLRRLCRRAAFFVVRKGALCGWLGDGVGVHPEALREASLPLAFDSTFRDVVATRLPFRGPVTDVSSRDFLIDALGWAPVDMLAIPVVVRGRVVGILYGDERTEPLPDDHLAHVIRAAETALERVLAARKAH